MLLYILIGIIGAILPAIEKYLFQKFDFNNLMLLRFILGSLLIFLIINYNNSLNLNKIKTLSFTTWI